ncbi:DUF3592 domain-containing protein [Catellatospora sp. NPDC049133]|uniref:DUF3592 domain-containing protein n=1 Tax=Catellatospora sp. NPDC049133 TaxID=3155499 RepID=UPI0033E4D8E4
MTWTFRRMMEVLGAAALLGLSAFAVYWLGAQERGRIVEQGQSVSATVVATHDSRWADSSDVAYRLDGATHRARLYGTWHGTLEAGTRITVFRDPADPVRLATAEGYATDESTLWPLPMAAVAGALALAAVLSRYAARRRDSR